MKEELPLKFLDGSHLQINYDYLRILCEELEEFLESEKHLHTKAFAKSVMFSHEIKANNQVEGYNDDVLLVQNIIKKNDKYYTENAKKRILNLYHGYNYILKESDINKDTLKKLYSILSKDLLEEKDKVRMGSFYRNGKVYIINNNNLADLDEGMPVGRLDEFMNAYFNFLNNLDFSKSITDEYIKSQILHFYFVYIHPYFDVNGRTSRTLAMWYLLNKKAYPYIIFNRGITFHGNNYDKVIRDVKYRKDISYFIDFMLKTVQIELEKEYIVESIENSSNKDFTAQEFQTLLYILSMNGNITVKDFAEVYNRFNSKKKCKEIYETMLDPLIKSDVLNVVRCTNSNMFGNTPNEVLEINPGLMHYDKNKIKRLTKYR